VGVEADGAGVGGGDPEVDASDMAGAERAEQGVDQPAPDSLALGARVQVDVEMGGVLGQNLVKDRRRVDPSGIALP
jgi:hypothetical protein